MTMERFDELKKEILRRAHEARACTEQYGRAYRAETLDALMQVVRDNFHWCCINDVIDGALIDAYREEFNAGKIWHNEKSITEGFMLATGSASVKATGSASVEAYGSASVEATGSASVEAYDSASVKATGSASVEAYDSASVKAYGSASVKAYDSAYVYSYNIKECKLYGHAIYRIINFNEVRYADETMKFVKVEEGE